jgi:GNAT superfamily N-acetyltransferase
MPVPPAVACRHYTAVDLADLRVVLFSLYTEVYADRINEPFLTVDRFQDRLTSHTSQPNWEAVVGYVDDQPVGYAYGASRAATTVFWQHVAPAPDAGFARETGNRTFALFELMVRAPWRKTGVSRALHHELIHGRHEERVCLFVEHDHPKVRALYEKWGYAHVGVSRPGPEAPLYDVMILSLIDRQQSP